MQTKELELTNVSSLPLTALLALEYPFQLVKWDSPRDDDKEADESNVQLVTRDVSEMQITELALGVNHLFPSRRFTWALERAELSRFSSILLTRMIPTFALWISS